MSSILSDVRAGFFSLRGRLILLILLIALPAFALSVYTGIEDRRNESASLQENLLQLVKATSNDEHIYVQNARSVVSLLAQSPAVRSLDLPACNAQVKSLLQPGAPFTNIAVWAPNGDLVCSAVPITGTINSADRPYFQEALRTKKPIVAGYVIGRLTGQAGLTVLEPALGPNGEILAIPYVAIDLSWIRQAARQAQLGENSRVLVIDRQGVIFLREPDPEGLAGRSFAELPVVQKILSQHQGTVDGTAPDGVNRLFAFSPLNASGDASAVYLAFAVPSRDLYAHIQAQQARNLVGLALIIAITIIAAWYGSDMFFLRRIDLLSRVASYLTVGETGTRTGLTGDEELAQLGRALDSMAEALEEREGERVKAVAAEHEQRVLAEALYDTAAALTSTLNFDEVLDRILSNVGRVARHDAAAVLLIQGNVARIAKYHGYSERGLRASTVSMAMPLQEATYLAEMADSEQALAISNTEADKRWAAGPELRWVRSFAGAPIKSRGQVIGFLAMFSATPGFFDDTYTDRLQVFADQVAIAVDNARLYDEARQRVQELESINRISVALRGLETADEALPVLLDETLRVMGTTAGSILLYDEEHGLLRQVAMRGWFGHIDPGPMRTDEGIAGAAFGSGQIYLSREFRSDARARPAAAATVPTGWGGACVPIRSGYQVVGVMFVAVQLPREIQPSEVRLLNTIAELGGSAVHRLRVTEEAQLRAERMASLRAVDIALTNRLPLHDVLEVIVQQCRAQLGADAADVLLVDPVRGGLEVAAAAGFRGPLLRPVKMAEREGLGGGMAEGQVAGFANVADAEFDTGGLLPPGEDFVAYYRAPIYLEQELRGVLEVFHRSRLEMDKERREFLEALAWQCLVATEYTDVAAERDAILPDLGAAYDNLLLSLADALDLQLGEERGHTRRLADSMVTLARAMGVPDDGLKDLWRGALLHDIGMISVPPEIRNKPGPLSEDEWQMVREHPEQAYRMLSAIPFLRPMLDIPYCHHERWDGTGYPRQRRAERIPLPARIYTVIDVWHALSSKRPWRNAWPPEDVVPYLSEQAGKQFDPRVVEIFLRLLNSHAFEAKTGGAAPAEDAAGGGQHE